MISPILDCQLALSSYLLTAATVWLFLHRWFSLSSRRILPRLRVGMGSLLDMDVDCDGPPSPTAAESSHDTISSAASGAQHLPQVRARITVVCAECKRLKLKCDRKMPCGSCVKREATSKCHYSAAAAEKVDLQSLNNRLVQLEQYISMSSGGQFSSAYPLAQVTAGSTYTPLSCSLGNSSVPVPAMSFPTISQLLQARVDPIVLTAPTRSLWTDWTWPRDIVDAVHLSQQTNSSDAQEPFTSRIDVRARPRQETAGAALSAGTFIEQADIGSGKLRAPVNLVDALPVTELLGATTNVFTIIRSILPGFFRCEYGYARIYDQLSRTEEKRVAVKQKARAQEVFFGRNQNPSSVVKPPGFEPNDPLFSSFRATGSDTQPKKRSSDDEWPLSFYALACGLMALSPTHDADGHDAEYWYTQSTQACQAWEQYCGTPSPKEGSNYISALLVQLVFCLGQMDIAGASAALHKAAMFFRAHHLTVGARDDAAIKPCKDGRDKWMGDAWLDIIFWDAFVSDKMGQPPLISEGCVPAMNRDESEPDLFAQRFRLASIVRLTKTRYWTLEALEAEITQFTRSIAESSINVLCPPMSATPSSNAAGKRKRTKGPPDILGESEHREDEVKIQRMDLILGAWQTLLAAYTPEVQHDHRLANPKWTGMVNVAHHVVQAATDLLSHAPLMPNPSKSHKTPVPIAVGARSATSCNFATLASLYPLHGNLFSAALICGYGSIKQPSSIWASGAGEAVRAAHAAFSSPVILKLGDAVGDNLTQREALHILDVVLRKLQGPSGRKRKHDECIDACSSSSVGARPPKSAATLQIPCGGGQDESTNERQGSTPLSERVARMGEAAKEKNSERPEKKKRISYPTVGVRVRSGGSDRPNHSSGATADDGSIDQPASALYTTAPMEYAHAGSQYLQSVENPTEYLQHAQPDPIGPSLPTSSYAEDRPTSTASLEPVAFSSALQPEAQEAGLYEQQGLDSVSVRGPFDNITAESQRAVDDDRASMAHPSAYNEASHIPRSRRPSTSYDVGAYEHPRGSFGGRASYRPCHPPPSPCDHAVGLPMLSASGSSYASIGNRAGGAPPTGVMPVPPPPPMYTAGMPPIPPPHQQCYDACPTAQPPQPPQAYEQHYQVPPMEEARSEMGGYYPGQGYGTYDVKPNMAILDMHAQQPGGYSRISAPVDAASSPYQATVSSPYQATVSSPYQATTSSPYQAPTPSVYGERPLSSQQGHYWHHSYPYSR